MSTDNKDPKDSEWTIGTIILCLVALVPISALLYGLAPYIAAGAGIFGATWLLTKAEDIKGKWGKWAFLISFFGFGVSALLFGVVTWALLSAPAWLLFKLGVFSAP